jgi:hypothetical protein
MDAAEVATVPHRPEVWFGVGVGMFADGEDRRATGASFGPGPTLRMPLMFDAGAWRARVGLRVDAATGQDRVEWSRSINGESVRFYNDAHWTGVALVGAVAGIDAMFPASDTLRPFVGVGLGPAVVWNFHSFGGDSQILLDPLQNELDDPLNVDPYSVRAVPLTEARVGVQWDVTEKRALWLEVGSGGAFVPEAALRKAPTDVGAVRTAFGWTGIDVVAGYAARW